ncbi:MAG: hypothetical protein P8164_08045 [Gammaproteobacteria bacterium]|jgi:DNA-binding IscR family transcriptional regulator
MDKIGDIMQRVDRAIDAALEQRTIKDLVAAGPVSKDHQRGGLDRGKPAINGRDRFAEVR